jgi:hypothetical protein
MEEILVWALSFAPLLTNLWRWYSRSMFCQVNMALKISILD